MADTITVVLNDGTVQQYKVPVREGPAASLCTESGNWIHWDRHKLVSFTMTFEDDYQKVAPAPKPYYLLY